MKDEFTILSIDDNPDDRELYRRALKKLMGVTYHCLEATDGQDGLAVLKSNKCDCVLLDYSLPGMDGLDVLRQIHADHPFLPVIMLTGQGNEMIAAQAIKDGAGNYLIKSSITPDTLHRAVQETITRSALEKSVAEKDSELKEKTKALERSIDKLMESNSELERFAYICSHDLQEPLRMISNFTQRLQKHLGDKLDAQGQHYMKYVTDSSQQARQLIADVLNYARVDHESESLINIPVEEMLNDVLADFKARIEETGAQITHDALPGVYMQPMHLRQILQNLISNALKFCKGSPRIHISAVAEGEGMWRFCVKDNGIGVAPEHLSKMFSIFQRLHHREEYPGTGIGLAVCKKAVQKYGGKIEVESTQGIGSQFYFSLPAINRSLQQEAA